MTQIEGGPARIPVEELDKFEWLALEALWGTAKSPFPMQWERWQKHPEVHDPAGIPGLVIGGNLQRATGDIKNADLFGPADKPVLLSRAAEHIGKMAGGLIGISAHLRTPKEAWEQPLEDHISTHLEITDEVLDLAERPGETTLRGEYYLGNLTYTGLWLNIDEKVGQLDYHSKKVAMVAATAVRTWSDFMREHEGLALVPGATPRSSGSYIENLRAEFEHHVPTVHEAATIRQQ